MAPSCREVGGDYFVALVCLTAARAAACTHEMFFRDPLHISMSRVNRKLCPDLRYLDASSFPPLPHRYPRRGNRAKVDLLRTRQWQRSIPHTCPQLVKALRYRIIMISIFQSRHRSVDSSLHPPSCKAEGLHIQLHWSSRLARHSAASSSLSPLQSLAIPRDEGQLPKWRGNRYRLTDKESQSSLESAPRRRCFFPARGATLWPNAAGGEKR